MSRSGQGPDENEVRELLAGLGDSLGEATDASPIPAEVDDRIMTALAGLPPIAPEETGSADVVPLRSRRRVGGWLVAAALVVVVAGGGWALANRSPSAKTFDATSAAGSSSAADSSGPAVASGGRVALPSLSLADFDQGVATLLGSTPANAAESYSDLASASGSAPEDFGAKLDKKAPEAAAKSRTSDQLKGLADSPSSQSLNELRAPMALGRADCARPAGVKGRQIEVTIDSRLAQLIVSPATGERTVTAYNCAGDTQLASTTVR